MKQVIHVSRTCCVTLVRNLFDTTSLGNRELGLNSIDQKKAFDQVEHSYLLHTLDKFGFNSFFVSKVKTLYEEIKSMKIKGTLSAPLKVRRGVRQACPLSGMLYVSEIEPLVHKIRCELLGLKIMSNESKNKQLLNKMTPWMAALGLRSLTLSLLRPMAKHQAVTSQ